MVSGVFNAFVPIAIFAIIFGSVTAHRYMRHRETMKMIEHGYPPEMWRGGESGGRGAMPPPTPPVSPFSPSPPPEPPLASAPPAPPYPAYPMYPQPAPFAGRRGGPRRQLVSGSILVGVGVALSLALWPIGFAVNANGPTVFPLGIGPWMVAGFIPLFVGLALILTHVLGPPSHVQGQGQYTAPPTPGTYPAEPHER